MFTREIFLKGLAASTAASNITNYKKPSVSYRKVSNSNLAESYAGLSYEKKNMYYWLFRGSNTNLQNLFKLANIKVLRISGNSVDETVWVNNGSGLTNGKVSQYDIIRLEQFLVKANCQVIYGLPLKTQNPDVIAQEAFYAAQILGPYLYGFEISNEPNAYGWSTSEIIQKFQAAITAVKQAVPNCNIVGPDTSFLTGGTQEIVSALGNQIDLVTTHYYINSLNNGSQQAVLVPNGYLPYAAGQLQSFSKNAKLGSRFTEVGTFYGGGALGYSNTFMSAFWVIDAVFQSAIGGAGGINFHGGENQVQSYTPMTDDTGNVVQIRSEFYGLTFASWFTGTILPVNYSNDNLFTTYAVQKTDGRIFLALLNKHPYSLNGSFNVGRTIKQAFRYDLTAPSITSVTGQTFAGSPIGLDGSWRPAPTQLGPSTVYGYSGSNINLNNIPPYTAVGIEVF